MCCNPIFIGAKECLPVLQRAEQGAESLAPASPIALLTLRWAVTRFAANRTALHVDYKSGLYFGFISRGTQLARVASPQRVPSTVRITLAAFKIGFSTSVVRFRDSNVPTFETYFGVSHLKSLNQTLGHPDISLGR